VKYRTRNGIRGQKNDTKLGDTANTASTGKVGKTGFHQVVTADSEGVGEWGRLKLTHELNLNCHSPQKGWGKGQNREKKAS